MKKKNLTIILVVFILASLSFSNVIADMQHFGNTKLGEKDHTWTIVDIITPVSIPLGHLYGLDYHDSYLWVGDDSGGLIYQVDPADGSVISSFQGAPESNHGLAWDGTYFWVAGDYQADGNIYKMTQDGTVIATIPNPGGDYSGGLSWHNGYLWVSVYYPNTQPNIYEIDPSDGSIVDSLSTVGIQPQGLVFQDDNTLWNSMDDNDDDPERCTAYNPATGDTIWSFLVPTTKPRGLAWDGTYLYLVAKQAEAGWDQVIYKILLDGGGTPEINIPITNHNYGTVTVGDSATWNATAQNIGTADLVIDNVYFTGYNICVTCPLEFPITINPGNQEEIPFIYTPINPEPLNAIATIESNDPLHPEVDITLTGNAVNPGPSIYVPITSHNYGLVRINAITRWFMEIQNIGDETLVIDSIYCDDTHFTVDSDVSFPINIGVLDTIQIGVWFNPEEAILYEGTLFIESNDPDNNPFEVTLEGTGDDSQYEIGETLWQYHITTSWDNSPKAIAPIQDINGDNISDVIICSEDNYIRCFNGNSSGDADVLWEKEIYSGNIYSYRGLDIIEDINNDDYQDVIVATTGGDRSIRAISGKTGVTIWVHDTHEYGGGGWVYQVDCRYDYNNDGILDVLAATGDDADDTGPKRVYCLDGLTGLSIWEYSLGGPGFSVIGIEDCTGDGQPDVLAGASNEGETIGYAYGINGTTGNIIWTYTTTSTSVWALEQLNDINEDGIKDVIIGDFSGHFYYLDSTNGTALHTGTVGVAIILQFVKLNDVNGDGNPDFGVAHSSNSMVQVIDGYSGAFVWSHSVADQPWNASRIADVSGDGIDDLVVGTLYSNNYAYFLNGVDGSEIESISTGTPVDAIAAIPDIVGDGSMEMVVGGRNGWVYCYSGGLDAIVGVDEQQTQNDNFILLKNYPNPFSSSTTISFNLATKPHENAQIKIYNIKGQLIKNFELRTPNSELTKIEWNGKDQSGNSVSNGVYFYQLESKNYKSDIKKMIILR
ncbi:MAG: FlgD immunoglobulin-like domain containing protein [Candidatus Cloacimonadota bacterium]|nr:FlgD immunoglobulin-like domain containing protein [Candidatus Cloacimonadota bacterium]